MRGSTQNHWVWAGGCALLFSVGAAFLFDLAGLSSTLVAAVALAHLVTRTLSHQTRSGSKGTVLVTTIAVHGALGGVAVGAGLATQDAGWAIPAAVSTVFLLGSWAAWRDHERISSRGRTKPTDARSPVPEAPWPEETGSGALAS